MLFLKTFKDAKFVVDGNAFQTFITLSTKNFCLMLAVELRTSTLKMTLPAAAPRALTVNLLSAEFAAVR